MRSSFLKSTATALSLAAVLTLAAPLAEARPAQPRQGTTTGTLVRGGERILAAVRRILGKLTGGITTSGYPTIPIGSNGTNNDSETDTETSGGN